MEDERQWVESCLDGDTESFRPLVERYQLPVRGLLQRLTGNAEDARELAQEAFLRAYRKLASFDVERPFGAWIRTIATNLARDRLRRVARGEPRARATIGDRASGEAGPVDEAARAEESDRLRQAVASLEDEARRLVEMRYFEGLSLAEVAERTGVPRNTLKVRLFRLRKELLRRLES
jgi:RNA polymerase sigma factor (sigma-70 family)